MRRPSPEALLAAASVARRNHDREAQLRRLFVERRDVSAPTPLASMLRGGRGGSVRLKLYLSLIWLAAAPPHDTAYPARAWATLLDLPDPAGLGARRVNDAISWLETRRFVSAEIVPGHPSRLTLLDESGAGRKYRVPGSAYNRGKAKNIDPELLERHRYVRVPPTLWTSGWLATLSGPAIAMLLILLVEQGGRDSSRELWFSPEAAKLRYDLSDDTRSSGLRELRRAELIYAARRPVSSDVFDVRRNRNVYILSPERFSEHAEVPAATEIKLAASDIDAILAVLSS